MTNGKTKIENLSPELPGDKNLKEQINQIETDFKTNRPINIPPSEAKFIEKGPEKDRVYELNAEFLNQRLENYVEQIHTQEKDRVEKKYGKGLWGKLNRWLEETDLGKGLKVGSKIIGGSVATGTALVGSAGLAAPLALSLGARSVVDGVLEGIQYLRERGTIRDLQNLRNQRLTAVYDLAGVRNDIQTALVSAQRETLQVTEGTPTSFGIRLENLITRTAQVEEQILNQEKNLNLSQKRWKIGKFIAGLATVGLTTAFMGIYGINMGVKDLDKLKPTVEAMINGEIKQLVPYPPGASIEQAQALLTPSHELRLYLDGLNFVYDKSDIIKEEANVTQIARAGGILTHLVNEGWWGSSIPWQMYASCVASIAGLSGAAVKEIVDMVKLGKLSKEDMKAAIMSLRKTPRTTIVGADQEISPKVVTPADKFFEDITGGEIWTIRGNNPLAPNAGEPENYYKIKSKDDYRNELKIIRINRDSGQEEGNEITISAADFYNLCQKNNNIFNKKGESYDAIIAQEKAQNKTRWDKWLEDNDVKQGHILSIDQAILNNTRGAALDLNSDYRIVDIKPENGRVILEKEVLINNKKQKIKIQINLTDLETAINNNASHLFIGEEVQLTPSQQQVVNQPEYLNRLRLRVEDPNSDLPYNLNSFERIKKQLWQYDPDNNGDRYWKVISQNYAKTRFKIKQFNQNNQPIQPECIIPVNAIDFINGADIN